MKSEQLWLKGKATGSSRPKKQTAKRGLKPDKNPFKRPTLSPALPHSKTYGH